MSKLATLATYVTLAVATLSCGLGRSHQQDTSSTRLQPRTTLPQARVVDTVIPVFPGFSHSVLESQIHRLYGLAAAHEGLVTMTKTTQGQTTIFDYAGTFPFVKSRDRLEATIGELTPRIDRNNDYLVSPGELRRAEEEMHGLQEGLALIREAGYDTERAQVFRVLRTFGLLTPGGVTITVRYQRNMLPRDHADKLRELLPLIDTRKDGFLDAEEVREALKKAEKINLKNLPKPTITNTITPTKV